MGIQLKNQPFIDLELKKWKGLGFYTIDEFSELFGQLEEVRDSKVGYFPAICYQYHVDNVKYPLKIYERGGIAIMLEIEAILDIALLDDLEEPSVILLPELSIEEAYAHEYLYCNRGLLITVLEYDNPTRKNEIMRIRGFGTIDAVRDLKSDLYYPLDNQIKFNT